MFVGGRGGGQVTLLVEWSVVNGEHTNGYIANID